MKRMGKGKGGKGLGTKAFASESRLEQVKWRIVGAITAIKTDTPINEATASKMVRIEEGHISIAAPATIETAVQQAVKSIETRGVTVGLNNRRIVSPPDRDTHVAQRSVRASRSPAPPATAHSKATAIRTSAA